MMKNCNLLIFSILLSSFLLFTGCSDDDVPDKEKPVEIITDVILTFTPTGEGEVVTAAAQDPDGEGPEDVEIVSHVTLAPDTEYTLTIALENSVADEDITEEVEEEGDEHMFFFGWTEGYFTSPEGDGNIDNRDHPVNYQDFDENSLPVGLETTWVTGGPTSSTGTFRLVLKHQPDEKSATSTVTDGESDIDLTWDLTIQ